MGESIVRIPKNDVDYDFIAFTFNNKHSYEDMNIIRTSDGNRYNEDLAPTINDLTAEVPGGDGMYYFSTHHKQKVFNISFAFEHLEEAKLYELKRWLNGKDMGDLWFAEAPYKVYTAKVTGQPSLKMLCFDEDGKRIYKGEGTVQFTAYWPYAHTPDIIQKWNGNDWINVGSGLVASNYDGFVNYEQFAHHLPSANYRGDLPFYFVADLIPPKFVSTSMLYLADNEPTGLAIDYVDVDYAVDEETGEATIILLEATDNE